jgi:hypothetical protein
LIIFDMNTCYYSIIEFGYQGVARNAPTSSPAGCAKGRGVACNALMPGLLRRKRLAMTGREELHTGRKSRRYASSLHVIAKAKPEAIQERNMDDIYLMCTVNETHGINERNASTFINSKQ